MSMPPPIAAQRSMFVTVVAWVFIGLSAFVTLMLLLYSVMLPLIFLPMLHQQLLHQQPGNAAFPASLSPAAGWLFDHASAICYGFLSIALCHLVAAIGLLRRKEWGRRIFLYLLGFDVLHQLAAAAMQWWVIPPMQRAMMQMQFATGAPGLFPTHVPPPIPPEQQAMMLSMMDSMMAVTRVFGVLSAIVFIGVFGWIIKRLCSAAIRREFTSRPATVSSSNHSSITG